MSRKRHIQRLSMLGFISRWSRDARGVSALEFALTAPVFLAALAGFSEFGEYQIAARNVSNVTTIVGDLTGQLKTASAPIIDDEFAAANVLMAPAPVNDLSIRITSVIPVVTNGVVTGAKVDWCRSSNPHFPCPAQGAVLHNLIDGQSFPLSMLPSATSSAILCESQYTYNSDLQTYLPSVSTLKRAYFVNPREVAEIPYS